MRVHQLQVLCAEFETGKGHFPACSLDQKLCECGDLARRHKEAAHPHAANAGEVAHVQSGVGAFLVIYTRLNITGNRQTHCEPFA